jgi:hypothetical protein
MAGGAEAPIRSAEDFYGALLRGGAGARQAVAPSAMNISRVYGGAEKSLRSFMPMGGERNLARAQLGTEKARSIADLYTNVQPYAADKLATLGFGRAQAGAGFGGVATQGYGQLVDYQAKRNQAKGMALGGIGQGLGSLAGGWIGKAA